MIKFLLKGLLRDRSRSLFPVITVTLGVMLTVFLHSWFGGIIGEIIRSNANFSTGHLKVMTKAYYENKEQIPNDLALLDIQNIIKKLETDYPDLNWLPRIYFGGLIDIPDEFGNTRSQGPVMGFAVDLFSSQSKEIERLNLQKAVVQGRLPIAAGEIVISNTLAEKLTVKPGDPATLMGSTMYGSMALQNFTIVGTVKFGISAVDHGAVIADVQDMQKMLDMDNAAGEIFGYFHNDIYNNKRAQQIKTSFNKVYQQSTDEFSPVMISLTDQNGLGEYLQMASSFSGILIFIFVLAMSIVLWNAGLLGGLRRYGEVGVRLAIGENKGHIYRSLIWESVLIGVFGSLLGTAIGIGFAYYVQVHGIDIGSFLQNSSMMISSVIRTQITSQTYFIGIVPGLFSTVLGTMLSGIGIYKRETARLFKELEA